MVDTKTHCATRWKYLYGSRFISYNFHLSSTSKKGISSFIICDLEKFKEYPQVIFHRLQKQESPKGDFHWAANFLGEGVAAHLGHQDCRWPLRDVALYPFGRLSWQEKWVPFLSRSCIVPIQIPPLRIKKKEVSNSNQETISVIFTHPYPNPSALQNIVWLIWPNRKIIVVGDNNELTLFKRFISKLKNWPLNS